LKYNKKHNILPCKSKTAMHARASESAPQPVFRQKSFQKNSYGGCPAIVRPCSPAKPERLQESAGQKLLARLRVPAIMVASRAVAPCDHARAGAPGITDSRTELAG